MEFKMVESVMLLLILVAPCWSVVTVDVAEGSTASIPCDVIIQSTEADALLLVLFYRDEDYSKPIFTYDTRYPNARQWVSSSLNGRVTFKADSAQLEIEPVATRDHGLWHCRTEFEMAPSRTQSTKINVIENPPEPQILSYSGQPLTDLDGVFSEGDDVEILCRVPASKPMAQLTWHVDGLLQVQSIPSLVTNKHVTRSLRIERIQRHHSGVRLTCRSINSELTKPKNVTRTLRLNLKPARIEIRGGYRTGTEDSVLTLIADQTHSITCRVFGSSPPANVSWWRANKKLNSYENVTEENGVKVVESLLEWVPLAKDDGHNLTCKVSHSKFKNYNEFRHVKMDIQYSPTVELRLGNKGKDASQIMEGSDLTLSCDVRSSKPEVRSFDWYWNDHLISKNQLSVVMNRGSLVLHRVEKSQSGSYYCAARNVHGVGRSRSLTIKVSYVPICKMDGPAEVAVPKKLSSLMIPCTMEAEPPLVDFWWTYESSDQGRKSWDIPANWYSQQMNKSQLILPSHPATWNSGQQLPAPAEEDDQRQLGLLTCWGRNPAGESKDPCRIILLSEGPPHRPQSCKATVEHAILISCTQGFDGGSGVTFLLELWEPLSQHPIGKWTNSLPEFTIASSVVFSKEKPSSAVERSVEAHIVAVNIHGKSDAAVVQISQQQQQQLRNNSRQIHSNDTFPSLSLWLGLTVGAVVSIAATGVAAALCKRTGRPSSSESSEHPNRSRGRPVSPSAKEISTESVISSRRWNDTTPL